MTYAEYRIPNASIKHLATHLKPAAKHFNDLVKLFDRGYKVDWYWDDPGQRNYWNSDLEYKYYLTNVKKPMCLATVKRNLIDGKYSDVEMMSKDVLVIFDNAMRINALTSPFHQQASQLKAKWWSIRKLQPENRGKKKAKTHITNEILDYRKKKAAVVAKVDKILGEFGSVRIDASLKKDLLKILSQILKEKSVNKLLHAALVFAEPLDLQRFTDYKNFVENPMDLGTIKGKLKEGQYPTVRDFSIDVETVWLNCLVYNIDGDQYWKFGKQMEKTWTGLIRQCKLRKVREPKARSYSAFTPQHFERPTVTVFGQPDYDEDESSDERIQFTAQNKAPKPTISQKRQPSVPKKKNKVSARALQAKRKYPFEQEELRKKSRPNNQVRVPQWSTDVSNSMLHSEQPRKRMQDVQPEFAHVDPFERSHHNPDPYQHNSPFLSDEEPRTSNFGYVNGGGLSIQDPVLQEELSWKKSTDDFQAQQREREREKRFHEEQQRIEDEQRMFDKRHQQRIFEEQERLRQEQMRNARRNLEEARRRREEAERARLLEEQKNSEKRREESRRKEQERRKKIQIEKKRRLMEQQRLRELEEEKILEAEEQKRRDMEKKQEEAAARKKQEKLEQARRQQIEQRQEMERQERERLRAEKEETERLRIRNIMLAREKEREMKKKKKKRSDEMLIEDDFKVKKDAPSCIKTRPPEMEIEEKKSSPPSETLWDDFPPYGKQSDGEEEMDVFEEARKKKEAERKEKEKIEEERKEYAKWQVDSPPHKEEDSKAQMEQEYRARLKRFFKSTQTLLKSPQFVEITIPMIRKFKSQDRLSKAEIKDVVGKLSQMLPKIRAAVSLGKLNSQMLTKVEKFHELLKSTFADVCDVPGISEVKMKKPKKRFKLVVKSKKAKAPKPKPAPKPPNDTEDMKIDIVDDGKIDIVGSAPVSQEEPVKKKGPRRIKFKSQRKPVEITEEINLCLDCLNFFWKGPHAHDRWAGYMSEIEHDLTQLKLCLEVGQVSSAEQFQKIFLDIFETMEQDAADRIRDSKATMAKYLRYRFKTIYKYKVQILLPNFKPKPSTIKNPDALIKIVDQLIKEPQAKPFEFPVDPLEHNFLGYFFCVNNPICLDDVRKHILYKLYSNLNEFKKDVELVFVNAQRFFNNSSELGRRLRTAADRLLNLFKEKLAAMIKLQEAAEEERRLQAELDAAKTIPPEKREYTVERILDETQDASSGKMLYLVKWLGWAEHQATWEPIQNLSNAKGALAQWREHKDKEKERQEAERARANIQDSGPKPETREKPVGETLRKNPLATWTYDDDDGAQFPNPPLSKELVLKLREVAKQKEGFFRKTRSEAMWELIEKTRNKEDAKIRQPSKPNRSGEKKGVSVNRAVPMINLKKKRANLKNTYNFNRPLVSKLRWKQKPVVKEPVRLRHHLFTSSSGDEGDE